MELTAEIKAQVRFFLGDIDNAALSTTAISWHLGLLWHSWTRHLQLLRILERRRIAGERGFPGDFDQPEHARRLGLP